MSDGSTICEKPLPKVAHLPPWKVLLHNDDVNTAEKVINKVQEIVKFDEEKAVEVVLEAHEEGVALLLITHQEKAELIVESFESCKITVTTEKA